MDEILEKFYDIIFDLDEELNNSEIYLKSLKEYGDSLAKLKSTLTDEQKKLINELSGTIRQSGYAFGLAHFKGGFKMGFKMAKDCLK